MDRELTQDEIKRPQAQQIRLRCEPDRLLVARLADETERRLASGGSPATVLGYGITTKQADGFVLVEAARGVPPAVYEWMNEEGDILSYSVNDVPSLIQERDAFDPAWYQSDLPAPPLPKGYMLLATPVSIDAPSNERWLSFVSSEQEGEGLLYYEATRALLFLPREEALASTLHFYRMTATLLDGCEPGFLQVHAADLAALRRELSFRLNIGEEAQNA
jgi:hypothetical protein